MAVVVECADGVQLELMARKHRPGAPGQTNLIELDANKAQALVKAIAAAYKVADAPKKH